MNKKSKPRNKNGQGTCFYSKSKGKFVRQITVEDENGDTKRKTFYGDTPEECGGKEKKYVEKLNKLKSIPKDKREVTLIDILYDYQLDRFESNLICPNTYARHIKTIDIIKDEAAFATKPIHAVQEHEIKKYTRTLTDKSESMIKKIWQQMKLGFHIAVDDKIIDESPFNKKTYKRPHSTKEPKVVKAYEPEHVEVIVNELKNHNHPKNREDYAAPLLIQLHTGLRVGEVNALTEADIDFKKGVIYVNKTISIGKDGKPYIKRPKTQKGIREVPIFDVVKPILEEAIKKQQKNKYDLLFYNFKMDIPFLPTNSYASLKRICEKYDIPFQGQHALRHTFATNAVNKGIPPQVLKDWLGHESIVTTMNTYYNNQQDIIANAIDIMNN